MWKIYIQYTALRFELTTSRIWVVTHNHLTRAPAQRPERRRDDCLIIPCKCSQLRQKHIVNIWVKGIGCDTDSSAAASNTWGSGFESSHQQLLLNNYVLLTVRKRDENKYKRGREWPISKNILRFTVCPKYAWQQRYFKNLLVGKNRYKLRSLRVIFRQNYFVPNIAFVCPIFEPLRLLLLLPASVTIFGEISSLWPKFTSLW